MTYLPFFPRHAKEGAGGMSIEPALPGSNLLVIGANGGIGRQSVEVALEAGHHVTAVLRDPAKLRISHPNLEIVKGDVLHTETFERYLEGKDAVISAIGGKMNKPTTLYSEGNRNLLISMKKMGATRAFFISSSAIEISPLLPFLIRLVAKYVVQKLLKHGYADQRVMETIIKESSVDWTIIRPPRLTDKPLTGRYRLAINSFLKNCLSISRADVAHFMVTNLANKATYKTTIEIGY
jgi:putative NADH-flavin reductase